MKIAIGVDHVGFELKNEIIEHLKQQGIELIDVGTHNDQRCNYPEYGRAVAKEVISGRADKGIAICGTGVGISIAANKVPGIRAVVCSDAYSAAMSVRHNDANILCFGSRVIGSETAKFIVDTWLKEQFEGGRHSARVLDIENNQI